MNLEEYKIKLLGIKDKYKQKPLEPRTTEIKFLVYNFYLLSFC